MDSLSRRRTRLGAVAATLLLPTAALCQASPNLSLGADVRIKAPARLDTTIVGKLRRGDHD